MSPVADPVADPGADPGADPVTPPKQAPKPKPAKVAKPVPAAKPAPTGKLAVKLTTMRGGTLTVTAKGKELGRLTVAANQVRGPRALGSVMREESAAFNAPAGRHLLRFAFTNRDATTITREVEGEIREGGSLAVTVDIGVRGRDLDIKFE